MEYNLNSEVPFLATIFPTARRRRSFFLVGVARDLNIVWARATSQRSRGTTTMSMYATPTEGLQVLELRKVRLLASVDSHKETLFQQSSRTWRASIVNMPLLASEHDASAEWRV